MKLRIRESSNSLHEQDVEIEVKNKGILEVPEDKNVDDLPMSHFEKLVKKHGLSKITKALNNLQVWNKNDDKELSKWAGNMIDKLTKKFGKNESLARKRFNEDYIDGEYVDIDSLSRRYHELMSAGKIDQLYKLFMRSHGDYSRFTSTALRNGFSKVDVAAFLLCVDDQRTINNVKLRLGLDTDESLKEYYDAQDFDRGTEDMFNYDGSDMYDELPEDSDYKEDDLYEYELAIPRSSMNEFAEFVSDLFGERLEDIKNNDSKHVWVVSVDKSRGEVTVKCVCTEEEFKEIDKWGWR